uniref:C3H1-type domain-containing protein n=1 Tax=Caenorhabditis tropicalis TaxID=1561998 RepID=A0A1I7V4G2_9PELO
MLTSSSYETEVSELPPTGQPYWRPNDRKEVKSGNQGVYSEIRRIATKDTFDEFKKRFNLYKKKLNEDQVEIFFNETYGLLLSMNHEMVQSCAARADAFESRYLDKRQNTCPEEYKPVFCPDSESGNCKSGTRCQFIHKLVNTSVVAQASGVLNNSCSSGTSAAINQSLYVPGVQSDMSIDANQSLPFRCEEIVKTEEN